MHPRLFRLLAALYFVSGFVGLLDEVALFKYLSLVFGATAYASSAVLVAFMGGLALGALGASKAWARVRRPLVAYGALEISVGAICALAPSLLGLVARAYLAIADRAPEGSVAVHLLRGALATLVVTLPAIAMGATLPMVARVESGRRLTLLYALNTAGGAAGSLAAAYAIVPALGLAGTLRAGAAVSAAVGVIAAVAGRAVVDAGRPVEAGARAPAPARAGRWPIFLAFASGVLVFTAEVVAIHLLTVIVGTSVYAFGLIVATFLLALALGAWGAARLTVPTGLALTAVFVAATLPLWDRLPTAFELTGPYVTSWAGREAVRGVVAFAALVLPVTLMGTTFPAVLRGAGRDVGRVTAANTFGAIVGSVVSGFALLPALGSQRTLIAIAVAYAALALAALRAARREDSTRPGAWRVALVAAAGGLGALLLPRWDALRLTSGANVYFERQQSGAASVVSIHEDVHGGVTSVTRSADLTTLWTNGKFQGDDGFQMTAQHAFAHIPMLFTRRTDRALVIGLGTGTTLGAVASYPFTRIDVAELSPGILAAATRYFGRVNRGALADPRTRVRLEDGRSLLATTRDAYDLVTVELTSIWFAGAANLYSREFYEIAKAHLTEEGVLLQWIQIHHTRPREIAVQMATARSVLPHAAFFVRGHQGFLVTSRAPLIAEARRLAERDADPRVREALGPGVHLQDYLQDIVLSDDTIDRFVDDVARAEGVRREALISSDDNLLLEYATPRNNVPGLPSPPEMERELRAYRTEDAVARHLSR